MPPDGQRWNFPNSHLQVLRHPARLPHYRACSDLRASLPIPWPSCEGLRKTFLPFGSENLRSYLHLFRSDLSGATGLRRRASSNRQDTAQSRHRRSYPGSRSSLPSPLALRLHGIGNIPVVSRPKGFIPNELPLRCIARVSRFPFLYLGFVLILPCMILLLD